MPNYQQMLHEVVDGENRPICLLSEKEILTQRLWHRAVAVLLRDRAGHMLLRENDGEFGFSSLAPLPAFMAATQFCEQLLVKDWGNGHLHARQCGFFRPGKANPHAFVTIFEAILAPEVLIRLLAGDELILLDTVELRALQDRGYSFSALLLEFLS